MVTQRLPPAFADAYIALQAAAVGQPALITDDVETILGRPATPFAHWVNEHRDLFGTEHTPNTEGAST